MKKILLMLMTALVLGLLLTGCGQCEHQWAEADCQNPKTCTLCGETQGAVLDHSWVDATCLQPKTCSRCKATEGEAIDHVWVDATCQKAKHCSLCNTLDGKPLEHDWEPANCETPKSCKDCGATEGAPIGHAWSKADCENPRTCGLCGASAGEALGHTWQEATCLQPKTCTVCSKTEGEALGHDWVTSESGNHARCSRCREMNYLGTVPDSRFDPNRSQQLFGTWQGQQEVDGVLYFYTLIYTDDGRMICYTSAPETHYENRQEWVYYSDYGMNYIAASWSDTFQIRIWSRYGQVLQTAIDGRPLYFYGHSDSMADAARPLPGEGFDPAASSMIYGTWTYSEKIEGQTVEMAMIFNDKGTVELYVNGILMEEDLYNVRAGKIWAGDTWDALEPAEFELTDCQLNLYEGGESLTLEKTSDAMTMPGMTPDDRFDPELCRPLFGTWSGDVEMDIADYMGQEALPGLSLNVTMHMTVTFGENGRMSVSTSLDEDAFMAAVRAYTVELMYVTFEAQGIDRDTANELMLQNYGKNVEDYVDSELAAVSSADYEQAYILVFFADGTHIYSAMNWDSDMTAEAYSIDGDQLTLTEDGLTVVLTKQP